MKYLLFDTNIFIDILFDRNRNVSSHNVESLVKLLDYCQVKLVIPEIVQFETLKHVDEQFNEVEKTIKTAKSAVSSIHSINALSEHPLNSKNYKTAARAPLNDLYDRFTQYSSEYRQGVKDLINKLLSHPNAIHIDCNTELLNACQKRKVFKQAPFHNNAKDCYADSLIVETILSIQKHITFNEDDQLYFVSGNKSDFSDPKEKDKLHPDIINDLTKNNLKEKVNYVRSYSRLIGEHLKTEIEKAGLIEDFAMEERQKIQEFERGLEDETRQTAGLIELGRYDEAFENLFSQSEFVGSFLQLMKKISQYQGKLAELGFAYEEMLENLDEKPMRDLERILACFNEKLETIGFERFENNIEGINKLRDWLEQKCSLSEFDDYSAIDSLCYGDDVEILDPNMIPINLVMSSLPDSFQSNSTETLELKLLDYQGNAVAVGNIDIYTGYLELDDDGNVGEGSEESIDYSTDDIIKYVNKIANEYEETVAKEKSIFDAVAEILIDEGES